MTTVEDTLSDEEKQKLENAKRQAKRDKTKYGNQLPDIEGEDDE
jgi:hypothetical protein